jgi:hypothetical protein
MKPCPFRDSHDRPTELMIGDIRVRQGAKSCGVLRGYLSSIEVAEIEQYPDWGQHFDP